MLSKPVEKTTHVSLALGIISGPSSGVRSLTIPDTWGMAAPPYCALCVRRRGQPNLANPGLASCAWFLLWTTAYGIPDVG
nr:hypothetical protein [Tanacetum cinerariifolium]